MKIKEFISIEHKITFIIIAASTTVGFIYGLAFDEGSNITRMDFSGNNFASIFFQILSHNFLISLLVLLLSIFFYVGSSVPVMLTYFIFGDSFAVIAKKNGILTAFATYPHLIFETIQILLVLSIAFKISGKILEMASLKKKKNIGVRERIPMNLMVALVFMVLAAVTETIRIGYF